MADDLGYTPGTGATVATDDCAGRHAQVVKIAYSADGVATHVPADVDGLLVNLGANNDVTITSGTVTAVTSITNPLPAGNNNIGDVDIVTMPAITGTVTANAGTNLNTSALALEAGGNLAGVRTAVELIDNAVAVLGTATYTEAASSGLVIGAVRRDADTTLVNTTNEFGPLQMDANGYLKVEIFDGGGSHTVDGTVTANLAAGTNNIGDVDVLTINGVAPAFGTGARGATVQRVTIATDDSVPVTGTFWQATQPVSGTVTANLAAGTNNIGDVDVLSLPALPAGTNNIGDVDVLSIAAGDNNIGNVDVVTLPNVTLAAGTNTNEVVGDVAHSIAVSGNPIVIAGSSQDTDDTAPPNRVDAEGDATRLATDRDGSLFVRTHGPQVWTYHVNGSAALTDAVVHASPGAGLSLYVGTITFSSGAATAINMFLEEGASTVIGPYYLEAAAGRGMSVTFNPPRKITAATALTITTSAAIAHSVDITGFTAQG